MRPANLILENATVHLGNVNPRMEMHGDEDHLAIDLQMNMSISDTMLGMILQPPEPLIDSLWTPEDALVYSEVTQIQMDTAFESQLVHLNLHGVDGLIQLTQAKINKFRLEPAFGRVVNINFRIQAEVDGITAGYLCLAMNQDIELTTEPHQLDMLDTPDE